MIKVLLTGGGSGGHVYPLLAVLEQITNMRDQEFKVYYLGPASKYDSEFLERDVTLYHIPGSKLRRYFSLANFFDVPKFFWALLKSFVLLFRIMPDVIFSKGGPGALPVIFAAKFYFIPVIIHESDTIPGYTNRLSAGFAKRIAISFDYTTRFFSKEKVALVGNPVRPSLFSISLGKESARQHFGLETEIPTIFFLGGSQGAVQINDFISTNLAEFLKEMQIIHITGENNFEEYQKLIGVTLADVPEELRRRYRYFPYFDFIEMRDAYYAADIVVARSGSGTISEIAGFGRASILIPLEGSANNHQRVNALEYARTGAAIVMEKENFTPHLFLASIKSILADPARKSAMETAARAFFRADAAEVIANELVRIGNKK